MKYKSAGFTLIEVLIVMIIIGVISSYAFASYKASLLKSRRTDAQTGLTMEAQVLERCYSQNFSFKNCDNGGTPLPSSAPSQSGFYTVTLSATTTSYTISAAPVVSGPQKDDTDCYYFSINDSSVKKANSKSGSDATTKCWGN